MERERSVARDLRQQISTLAELVAVCSSRTKQLADDTAAQRTARQEALAQLEKARAELLDSEAAHRELQIRSKRDEDEHKLAQSLVEQKLRNEVLHLSSQIESCKLMSDSQQKAFNEERERNHLSIRALESKLVEGRAHWTTAERQLVTERDVLKQKLLAVSERVELETVTAKQLEAQLTAIREELARVVAAGDAERKSSCQMNSEVIQLKHQLQKLERSHAQLSSDNGRYKDATYKLEDEMKTLRLRADQLQGQLSISTSSSEKIKADCARDLETLRGEHGAEINRLQREHARAIEELEAKQDNYLAYLKKETAEIQTRGEQSSRQALLALEDRVGWLYR
jgi:chromosome segregation ATPase